MQEEYYQNIRAKVARIAPTSTKCSDTMDTADWDLCYEVQYLEDDRSHNYVHARPADEIKSNYPIDTT